jgi:hypothetical protein
MTVLNSLKEFQNLLPGQVLKFENISTGQSVFLVFDHFFTGNLKHFDFYAYGLDEEYESCHLYLFDLSFTETKEIFNVKQFRHTSSVVRGGDHVKCSTSSVEELSDYFVLEIHNQKPKDRDEEIILMESFGARLVKMVKVLLVYKK